MAQGLSIKTILIMLLVAILAQPIAICSINNSINNSVTNSIFFAKAQTISDSVDSVSAKEKNSSNIESKKEVSTTDDAPLPFMNSTNDTTEQPSGLGLLLRTLGALLIILGLLVVGIFLLKKTKGFNNNVSSDSPITVISTTNIGDKQSLSVVKFGNKTLLVGSTAQNMKVLATENISEDEYYMMSKII